MTKTTWDYTRLAEAYLKRPQYATSVIDELLVLGGITPGRQVCDVGAGVAHLTLLLAEKGLLVTAVEPNDAMRERGSLRTRHLENVSWHDGTGEQTGQPADSVDLVTFGSSFNVTDRCKCLQETYRILKPKGWFACMWNHRNLDDPLQRSIEEIIVSSIPEYTYGTRREDQTEVIRQSKRFGEVHYIQGSLVHKQPITDVVEAWRSHATLERQAGNAFHCVVGKIEDLLRSQPLDSIDVPYITRMWAAQSLKSQS